MGSKPRGISASRGSAVLGLSKYKTRLDVWLEIMEEQEPGFSEQNGYAAPKDAVGAALEWGSAMEPHLISKMESELSIKITDQEKMFTKTMAGCDMTCHLDGVFEEDDSPVIHEGKTTNVFTYKKEWGEPGTDHIPMAYAVQVQHQMGVAEIDKAIVTVAVFPKMQSEMGDICNYSDAELFELMSVMWKIGNVHQYPVAFCKETFKAMAYEYIKFWDENVIGRIPPEPETSSEVRALFTPAVGTVIATEEIERLSKERSQIKAEIDSASVRADDIQTTIMDFMRKNSNVVIDTATKKRCILYDSNGKQIHSYNGKSFLTSNKEKDK